VTFFTGGPTEVHARTVPASSTVVEAAGKTHTDLARGFIRAEVIAPDDLVDAGSEAECRA
jgi:ribosome-binding ATPase YchF (GTP1/OBG family)